MAAMAMTANRISTTMAVAGRIGHCASGSDLRQSHLERDEASRGRGGFVNENGVPPVGRAGRLSDHT